MVHLALFPYLQQNFMMLLSLLKCLRPTRGYAYGPFSSFHGSASLLFKIHGVSSTMSDGAIRLFLSWTALTDPGPERKSLLSELSYAYEK